MPIQDYVTRIEETCGEEKDFIIVLKYEKKEDAISKILKKATLIKSVSGIIYDLKFQKASFRLYKNGKMIFKKLKNKKEVEALLEALLS
jgi:hypothetical protein